MKDKEMTYEEIIQHLTKTDLKQFEPGGSQHFTAANVTAAPAEVLKKLCGIYKAVRPILGVVVSLPLIPPAIKNALRTFMSLMDSLCP